jgi:hypoxanthine-DNA glycosylase
MTLLEGLPPIIPRRARLAVLGSFPGEASLRAQQYYAHPRNQFWPMLSALWEVDLATASYPQRVDELHRRGLALWDAHASCRRAGSLDSAIRDAVPNDLGRLLREAPGLRVVAHNGGESARAMARTRALGLSVHRLPSTSPAHASWSFARKLEAWQAVFAQAGLLGSGAARSTTDSRRRVRA